MTFPWIQQPPPSNPNLLPNEVGRRAQIVVAALIAGVLMFAMVVLTVIGQIPTEVGGFMTIIGATFAAVLFIVRLTVPNMIAATGIKSVLARPQLDLRQQLAGVYIAKVLMGSAVLEGAAFFNLICCLVERSWVSLSVVAGLVSVMAVTFPSQSHFENWVEQVKRDYV